MGTNDLDASEACLECGACSEEEFLASEAFAAFKTGELVGTIIGVTFAVIVGIVLLCVYCCNKGKWHLWRFVSSTTL